MSEIIITTDDVRSVIKALSSQAGAMESIVSDISSAHTKLLLDDIFSIQNYSLTLLGSISSAQRKVSALKNHLSLYNDAASNAVSGLLEADANSAGNQTGASAQVQTSYNWLSGLAATVFPSVVVSYHVISIIRDFFWPSDNSSIDIVTISTWDRKQFVEEKTEEVHSYYEEIMADHEEWLKEQQTYVYNDTSYHTIMNFQDGIMKQSTNYNCTSTAWCYGDYLLTGQTYTAEDTLAWPQWGTGGAQFPGQGESKWYYNGSFTSMLTLAYSELQKEKPSVFYGYLSGSPHAVTIVGVSENVDPNNLKLSDFLVVDPADGMIKNLAEVGYISGERTIAYK